MAKDDRKENGYGFRKGSGDSGDRVTAETDIENDPSSAVTRDSDTVKAEEKDPVGDTSDSPVTAYSRCESNCQPITLLGNGNG